MSATNLLLGEDYPESYEVTARLAEHFGGRRHHLLLNVDYPEARDVTARIAERLRICHPYLLSDVEVYKREYAATMAG